MTRTMPPLVAREVLTQLDDAGIRYEVIHAEAGATTLRFDVDSFDRLGGLVGENNPEFDIDDGCPSCSNFGDGLALTELELADARKRAAARRLWLVSRNPQPPKR